MICTKTKTTKIIINCHEGNLLIDPDIDLRSYHPSVVSPVGSSERVLDWKCFLEADEAEKKLENYRSVTLFPVSWGAAGSEIVHLNSVTDHTSNMFCLLLDLQKTDRLSYCAGKFRPPVTESASTSHKFTVNEFKTPESDPECRLWVLESLFLQTRPDIYCRNWSWSPSVCWYQQSQ